MIITDTFVMLNNPKTGSSFARTVLNEINAKYRHAPRWKRLLSARRSGQPLFLELQLPDLNYDGTLRKESSQHGAYSQIPDAYRDREVVSFVRSPYLLFISHYEFRWWATHPPFTKELLAEQFPNFPDLSIDQFVDFCNLRVAHEPGGDRLTKLGVGDLSCFFIKMFYRDPAFILRTLDRETITSGRLVDLMPKITFLRQENLVEEFTRFLGRHGYSDLELRYIAERDRVNVTEGRIEGGRDVLLTPRVVSHIENRESLLLNLLEGVGIRYKAPTDEARA
jgi:hypothetical protein